MSLKISNVSKAFGDKTLFQNLSFDFKDNGIYAIVGESGKGKTTLLRMISGLDSDYSGEIISGGISNISFSFQEYRLFPQLSAIDNIIIALGELSDLKLRNSARSMLTRLGFYEGDAELLPAELSGGMKQRVSLARAFLRKTPILLLDEPTKELDEKIRAELYEIIKEEAESRLVIIVSHHAEDIDKLGATEINI